MEAFDDREQVAARGTLMSDNDRTKAGAVDRPVVEARGNIAANTELPSL
jgi:hypothetical protein